MSEPLVELARASRLRGLERLRFLAGRPIRFARSVLRGLIVVDQWNAGFASGGAAALLAGRPLDVRWLPAPPPRTFVADPFVVERDGVRALFVEQYDYRRDRGVIEAWILDGERVVERRRAIETSTHLSYPFPVEIDGTLFLIPENAAASEAAFYRCVAFPDRWERDVALFPALDAVDTTLFAHDGRWWALCTRYTRGSNVALHAYYAQTPHGPWNEHALNPIVVDVGSARPAGPPFLHDGALYRVGQDCSRTYGGAVVVARIDELTPLRYSETLVARVDPAPGAYCDGVHTVSLHGDTIVLDGKRTYRDLRYVSRLGRILRARSARRRAARAQQVFSATR